MRLCPKLWAMSVSTNYSRLLNRTFCHKNVHAQSGMFAFHAYHVWNSTHCNLCWKNVERGIWDVWYTACFICNTGSNFHPCHPLFRTKPAFMPTMGTSRRPLHFQCSSILLKSDQKIRIKKQYARIWVNFSDAFISNIGHNIPILLWHGLGENMMMTYDYIIGHEV